MSTEPLLRRLAQLDHTERLAELVAHVRSSDASEVEQLFGALTEGDVYQRQLALLVVELRQDLASAWAAIADPSLSVRRLAAGIIGRRTTTIHASVLDTVDPATLRTIFQHLVRRRRTEVAEPLVVALCERARLHEAGYLLSVCSSAFIEERLTAVAWPDEVWVRLSKHHSEVMADHIEQAFVAAERPDLVWRRFARGVWNGLAEHQPARVADWIDRFADADSLPVPHEALPALIRWSCGRVVGWLRARVDWLAQTSLPAGLPRRVAALEDAILIPLCEGLLRACPAHFVTLVRRLPWPRRGKLFEAAVASLSIERREWSTALLDVLPEPLRDREATRMLGLQRANKDAAWRRELLGRRSIEQARSLLCEQSTAAAAADRGQALAALVSSTALSRRGMDETLAWLQRIRNDHDPVRMTVIGALCRVPAHQFQDHVALDEVVAPVFYARDTSYSTRTVVATLAKNLLTANATDPTSSMFQLGVSLLARLAGQAGTLDLPQLHRNLPRGAEQAIVDALMPWLEADEKRLRDEGILRLWHALQERAWEVESLGELMGRLIWKGNKANAGRIAECWIQDPRTRDARVRELVKRDRSALYVHGVLMHCHRRRQTLLVDRFKDPAPQGRFHTGKVVVIPPFYRGVHRWTPQLQRQYLQLLDAADAEPRRYSRTRAALVHMRARIPLTEVADLATALSSSDVNVVEAALAAMTWTDRPAPALAPLLEHLDGDRARVAMYAMPRLARLLPAKAIVEAVSTLLERPRLKVTVHKEALRLLGRYPTAEAIAVLHDTWQKPLHRDVRIAALHAARRNLSQPQAWELLTQAAVDRSVDVARAIVEVPARTIAQAHRARYLSTMAQVADHPDPTARAHLFASLRAGWSIAAIEPTVALATRVIERLDPLDPWRDAVDVLVEGMRSPAAHPGIQALVEGLLQAAAADVRPAGERDQLPYQRLLATMQTLCAERHPVARGLLEDLAGLLLPHPLGWVPGVHARVSATANDALVPVLLALLEAAPTPRSCTTIEQASVAAARQLNREWSAAHAGRVIDTLTAGEPPARVLAAAMLGAFGPRWGWSTPWTERLALLRQDSDHDVQAAARSVWVATA